MSRWRSSAALAASGVALVTFASAAASGARPAQTVERLVGQSIVTGVNGRVPSPDLLARIRAGQVGGVVLFARNVGTTPELSRLVAELQAAATEGGNPPLLVAVDQEGGSVRRLPAGPPDRSPAAMGREDSAAVAESQGRATAVYLKQRGIDVDLAPVLDTPVSGSSFLGSRAFGHDRHVNARLGAAFVRGLQSAGAAATAKHFPGLGTASVSTDRREVVLHTRKGILDGRLLPFKCAISAGVKLVMASNAGYTAYDPTGLPAVLSRPIVTGLLRERLGFEGVVISDAMEAPGPGSRHGAAVAARAAGVDLLLYTNERTSAAAYDELLAAAREGTLASGPLRSSAARVAALKRWLARG